MRISDLGLFFPVVWKLCINLDLLLLAICHAMINSCTPYGSITGSNVGMHVGVLVGLMTSYILDQGFMWKLYAWLMFAEIPE